MTAYRRRAIDKTRCYLHARADAVERCGACNKPICEVCATFKQGVRCPACERSGAHGARARQVMIALAIFGSIIAVALVIPAKASPIKVESPRVSRASLEREAAARPCDEDHIVALVRLIAQHEGANAGFERAIVHRYQYGERCGPMPKLAREIAALGPDAGQTQGP